MRVGPMPLVAADKIIRLLDRQGHEAQLEVAGAPLDAEELKTADARTENPSDLCYVTFDDSYLEFVRADLVRLALIEDHEMVSSGNELDGEDWMCPKCHKAFEQPGECPTHHVPLVTFEDYARGKTGEANKMSPMNIVLIVVIAAAVLYAMSKH